MGAPLWALGIALVTLWTNTLIIAGEALLRIRWIRRHRPIRPWDGSRVGTALIRGTIKSQGPLGVHRIEQRGRLTKDHSVAWHDRSYTSEVPGGVVETAFGPVTVPTTEQAEVWPRLDAQQAAAGEDDNTRLADPDTAAMAKRAKGILRTVEVRYDEGDEVFVLGRISPGQDGWTLEPLPAGPIVVSGEDPTLWSRKSRIELFGFAWGAVGLCGLLTAGAVAPPAFGLRSTLFGAACLLYFLLVQPAGVWMRGRTIEPAFRKLGGDVALRAR